MPALHLLQHRQVRGAGHSPSILCRAPSGSRQRPAGLQQKSGTTRTVPLTYPQATPEPRHRRRSWGLYAWGVWPLEPGKGTKRVEFTRTTFPGERSCGPRAGPQSCGGGRDGCWEPGSPNPRLRDPSAGPAALSPPVHPTKGPCRPARVPERATHPAPNGERTPAPRTQTARRPPRRPADKACTGALTPRPETGPRARPESFRCRSRRSRAGLPLCGAHFRPGAAGRDPSRGPGETSPPTSPQP